MSRSLTPLVPSAHGHHRQVARERARGARRPERTAATPDVVVWQADGRPLAGVGYAERIVSRLRPAGWSVAVVDYRTETLTEAQRAAPVHILSGGETSAFAGDEVTEATLLELTGLAQRAWADELTLIGICLGAQLLSRVIAPELPRSTPTNGMEAGWQPVEGPTGTVHAAELHYEQIDPSLASIDGITVTHGNDHSPVQAFRWGSVAIGMQFHPEWSHRDAGAVIDRHREVLSAHHRDVASVHRSVGWGAGTADDDLFAALVIDPVAQLLGERSATADEAVAV